MWKEHIEEGVVWYIHEKLGNIQKTVDGKYVIMAPRVFRLGPFDNLEEAQKAAEDTSGLNRAIDNYNLGLVQLIKAMKG